MEKEDIVLLSQILSGMKDLTIELERAIKKDEKDKVLESKKEILDLRKDIEEILRKYDR